jgi:hypothetical protein
MYSWFWKILHTTRWWPWRPKHVVFVVVSDLWSRINILQCPRMWWRYDQHPRLHRRCAAYLASHWITNSSAGRQVSDSIAPVGVVRSAAVIPKHASLCTLFSLFWH